MALAVESPARGALSFRTNDDKVFGVRWTSRPNDDIEATPVPIDAAVATFAFDPPPGLHVDPRIVEPPDTVRIDSTTPDDPAGWIDADLYAQGVVLVTAPYGIWVDHGDTGVWDVVALSETVGRQTCLARGTFVVEQGVST